MGKKASQIEEPYRPLLNMSLLSEVTAAPSTQKVFNPTEERTSKKEPEPNPVEKPVTITTFYSSHREGPQKTSFSEERVPRYESVPTVEKLDQEKRVLMSRLESNGIDRLVTSLADRLGTPVKSSHVLRALVALLLNAGSDIDRRARDIGRIPRPANGDAKGIQRFERTIASLIGEAIRDAGPLR
jgi:hypothetical protein